MLTNFTTQRHLVLTNSENKTIAVIECEKGLNDISRKIMKAIGEDYDCDLVILRPKIEPLTDVDYDTDFIAAVQLPEDGLDDEKFNLQFIQIY